MAFTSSQNILSQKAYSSADVFGRSDLAQSTSLAKIHVRMGSFTGSDSGRLPQYRMTNGRTKRRNSGSNRRRGSCNMMFAGGARRRRFRAGRPVGKRIHHRDDLDVSLGRLLDEVVVLRQPVAFATFRLYSRPTPVVANRGDPQFGHEIQIAGAILSSRPEGSGPRTSSLPVSPRWQLIPNRTPVGSATAAFVLIKLTNSTTRTT